MKPRLFAVVAFCALAACLPETPGQNAATDPAAYPYEPGSGEPRLAPEVAAACVAAGGRVRIPGLFQGEICVPGAPDAGQSCDSASDCAGFCSAETRTCSALDTYPGCLEPFLDTDGAEQLGICAD